MPNSNPKIVSGQSIIGSKKFQESTYDLPIALGKTITNEVFMVDLCKMPHVLVAGATGLVGSEMCIRDRHLFCH